MVPPTTSELLTLAKQATTPSSRTPERGAERLLRQAKNIDAPTGPSFMDTAEERLLRRNYSPVESRPLYEPETVRPPYALPPEPAIRIA